MKNLHEQVAELDQRVEEGVRDEFYRYLLRLRARSRADLLESELEAEAEAVAGLIVQAIRDLPDQPPPAEDKSS